MRNVLSIIQDVLSTPAIFVGLIAMLGLLLQKKDFQSIIKGTIKTILGFIVLNAGASVVQDAIIPFGDLFQLAFGVHGVVPNNEAITSLGLNELAVETSAIFQKLSLVLLRDCPNQTLPMPQTIEPQNLSFQIALPV